MHQIFALGSTEIGNGGVTVPQLDVISRISSAIVYEFENYTNIFPILKTVVTSFMWISLVVSVFCIIGIIISVDGIIRIRRREHELLYAKVVEADQDEAVPDPDLSARWQRVLELVESTNDSDWRQAIIEADIMLEDLLVRLGYQGAGVGERLKRANTGDFKTLDKAGEAHGIRNRIAHDGSNFVLNPHEVRRVISLFREVFEEFYYI
ncbi:MAG: hypothetical protein RIT04_678 [Candidatus Parcubacteria bacterium]|jgi:GNAT superfamily N-acetyltransferase